MQQLVTTYRPSLVSAHGVLLYFVTIVYYAEAAYEENIKQRHKTYS